MAFSAGRHVPATWTSSNHIIWEVLYLILTNREHEDTVLHNVKSDSPVAI